MSSGSGGLIPDYRPPTNPAWMGLLIKEEQRDMKKKAVVHFFLCFSSSLSSLPLSILDTLQLCTITQQLQSYYLLGCLIHVVFQRKMSPVL